MLREVYQHAIQALSEVPLGRSSLKARTLQAFILLAMLFWGCGSLLAEKGRQREMRRANAEAAPSSIESLWLDVSPPYPRDFHALSCSVDIRLCRSSDRPAIAALDWQGTLRILANGEDGVWKGYSAEMGKRWHPEPNGKDHYVFLASVDKEAYVVCIISSDISSTTVATYSCEPKANGMLEVREMTVDTRDYYVASRPRGRLSPDGRLFLTFFAGREDKPGSRLIVFGASGDSWNDTVFEGGHASALGPWNDQLGVFPVAIHGSDSGIITGTLSPDLQLPGFETMSEPWQTRGIGVIAPHLLWAEDRAEGVRIYHMTNGVWEYGFLEQDGIRFPRLSLDPLFTWHESGLTFHFGSSFSLRDHNAAWLLDGRPEGWYFVAGIASAGRVDRLVTTKRLDEMEPPELAVAFDSKGGAYVALISLEDRRLEYIMVDFEKAPIGED